MASKPSSQKVTINADSSASDLGLQNNITLLLVGNGGVKRIQDTLQQRLDEAGWSQSLREYVDRLFRSGEAQTFDDAMKKVMLAIKTGGGTGVPDLAIPQPAKDDGAAVVKRELREIVEFKK
nr:hypothetical protein CFP56_00231 [Quercus suber]